VLFRLVSAASTVALTVAWGTSITQIGGVNGLTTTYITSGCAAPNGPDYAGCIAGSAGTFTQNSYSAGLFSGATGLSAPLPNGNVTGGAKIGTAIPFSLINQASVTPGSLMNYWAASGDSGGGESTLVVPVGIFGQQWVALMLDNQWGIAGDVNAFIELDFGTSSDVANAGSLDYAVVNGLTVRDATDCNGSGTCSEYAETLAGSQTANVWNATYTGNTGPAPYGGTSGKLNLDEVSLPIDSAHSGYYLVDVQITDFGGGTNISQTGLTAITVGTPEPPSLLLLAAALLPLVPRRRWGRRFRPSRPRDEPS